MTEQLIQALHAGISRRDWHATEVAANALRDALSLGHPIQGEAVAAENVQALVELWRDMDKSHKVPDKFLERLSEVIDCINSAQPSTAEVTDAMREAPELRFKDLLGHYESPADLASGMRMSARHWREQEPSSAVPQPRIMADFHDRVAVALERALDQHGKEG